MPRGDYYIWREHEGELAGEPIRWAGKPGLPSGDEIDPALQLLVSLLEIHPDDRVLDLRCGAGQLGVLLARRTRNEVVLADDHGLAVEAARRTLSLNNLGKELGERVRILHGDGYGLLDPESFDVVCLSLPKGKELARRLVYLAAWYLKPGGRFYVAGPKRGGVQGILKFTRELFGNIREEAYGGGCRAACAVRPSAPVEDPGDGFGLREAEIGGKTWRFFTHPALFAYGAEGLDPGTRLLVEHLAIEPGERALDLGCGSGIVGLIAACQYQAEVVLVDVSAAALEASRRTLALYDLPPPQAEVRYSDVIGEVRGERFDVVLTYPPAHPPQGWALDRETARAFVKGAARVLHAGGRAYVVGSAGLPFHRWLRDAFPSVEVLAGTGTHQLYRAERPRNGL